MGETITILSWNVQGEIGASAERIRAQLDFLETYASDVDVFSFQAVHYERDAGTDWGGQLGAFLRYFERGEPRFDCVHTADWAHECFESEVQPQQDIHGPHNRCNLTVSRWPVERTPLPLRMSGNRYPNKLTYYTNLFPEKILVSELDLTDTDSFDTNSLRLWNVGVINGSDWHEEKIKMLETIYSRIYLYNEKIGEEVVLAGDFNAPKRETRAEITPHNGAGLKYTRYPFYGAPYAFEAESGETAEFTFRKRWERAERNCFDPEVSEWDMVDVYWTGENSPKRPSTDDYTHVVHNGTPSHKRLDHIFASGHFDTKRCEIWNGKHTRTNGLSVSDHAPVVAELKRAG